MTEQSPWRPTRGRVLGALYPALVLVAVCTVALSALTVWVVAGKAGSPARISVSSGRVFLPYDPGAETAALFVVTNRGGADDRLLKVTSPATGGKITLRRPPPAGSRATSTPEVTSATVPAGGVLSMSPEGLDVTLTSAAGWRVGDTVPFTLHFERSGAVKAVAVVR
ncbi:copper chaperone PCu(A)C [Streptomyces sp. HD1123-B1]|uniref:copper chaperone PCu(A)C n=1 Tax=Streptomyces huangiella TaxID=3228804 RepID=UPI003D7E0A64